MKSICSSFAFLLLWSGTYAQPLPDSVKSVYQAATSDYERHECLHVYLEEIRSDSNFKSIAAALQNYFNQKKDQSSWDYVEVTKIGMMSKTGDYATALDKSLDLVKIFHNRNDLYGEVLALYKVSQALWYGGDIKQSHLYFLAELPLALKLKNNRELALCYNAIASDYAVMNMPDLGIWYGFQALDYARRVNNNMLLAAIYGTLGENYVVKKEFDSAIVVSKAGIPVSTDASNTVGLYVNVAQSFLGKQLFDSAKHYAGVVVKLARLNNFYNQLQFGYKCLSQCYEHKGNTDSAFKYFKLAVQTKDELFSAQKENELKAISLREQAQKQKAEQERTAYKNRVRIYILLLGMIGIMIIAFILFRANRQKQRAKLKIEQAYNNLKSTQQQLIQSEKMASLGELTAGIAHEIQNPLNFVNNFSDVNKELLAEMKDEIDKGNLDDVKTIANDVIDNEEKINHHGKRADAIVKGMLQHSRRSSSVKEPTDINALADEYLRLAYHGLRAKDKSFNATMKTDFDESIGNIKIIPQDIGRVILNLINNAFYAVDEKKRQNSNGYEPTVSVSTKKSNGKIEIIVKDNGNGIPQKVLDKIFQPFFTTKPTGQGTGLGLSLSYDIITKGHAGELMVETKEGEGTIFIVQLPL
ncbi:MAG TPA: ATP-binding protein [Chitinophagaceae bacterium]|jgi:signal transduction histidine kinase|nr:ATP-binding protein [Chitinophagaceae bacterium]